MALEQLLRAPNLRCNRVSETVRFGTVQVYLNLKAHLRDTPLLKKAGFQVLPKPSTNMGSKIQIYEPMEVILIKIPHQLFQKTWSYLSFVLQIWLGRSNFLSSFLIIVFCFSLSGILGRWPSLDNWSCWNWGLFLFWNSSSTINLNKFG